MLESPENIIKEMKKKRALTTFLHFKKKSEKIPHGEELKELMHGNKEEELAKLKCSKSSFVEIANGAHFILDIVGKEAHSKCEEIETFIKSLYEKFDRRELATREEVRKIDEFLDDIIAELKK